METIRNIGTVEFQKNYDDLQEPIEPLIAAKKPTIQPFNHRGSSDTRYFIDREMRKMRKKPLYFKEKEESKPDVVPVNVSKRPEGYGYFQNKALDDIYNIRKSPGIFEHDAMLEMKGNKPFMFSVGDTLRDIGKSVSVGSDKLFGDKKKKKPGTKEKAVAKEKGSPKSKKRSLLNGAPLYTNPDLEYIQEGKPMPQGIQIDSPGEYQQRAQAAGIVPYLNQDPLSDAQKLAIQQKVANQNRSYGGEPLFDSSKGLFGMTLDVANKLAPLAHQTARARGQNHRADMMLNNARLQQIYGDIDKIPYELENLMAKTNLTYRQAAGMPTAKQQFVSDVLKRGNERQSSFFKDVLPNLMTLPNIREEFEDDYESAIKKYMGIVNSFGAGGAGQQGQQGQQGTATPAPGEQPQYKEAVNPKTKEIVRIYPDNKIERTGKFVS